LSKAIELDPKFVAALRLRGSIYCDCLGQPEKAVADFSKAIELEPKFGVHWFNRGNAYRRLGEPEKAVADYSKALELDPQYVDAWFLRSIAQSNLGQYAKAIADCSRAVELNPKHAGARNHLAWLLATCPDAKLRDPNRAVTLARNAVQLAPQDADNWTTLGMAQYRAGDWKAAVAALDKSVALREGGHPLNWFVLAMAQRKLGNDEAARKAYDQAVQWLDENKETLAKDKTQAEELRRFRSEAEEVLELKKK
jgi:tetratricopeptide (TPR) repeat protein